jgi:hypothetical protein
MGFPFAGRPGEPLEGLSPDVEPVAEVACLVGVVVERDRHVGVLDRAEHVDHAPDLGEGIVEGRRADVGGIVVRAPEDEETVGANDLAESLHDGPSRRLHMGEVFGGMYKQVSGRRPAVYRRRIASRPRAAIRVTRTPKPGWPPDGVGELVGVGLVVAVTGVMTSSSVGVGDPVGVAVGDLVVSRMTFRPSSVSFSLRTTP